MQKRGSCSAGARAPARPKARRQLETLRALHCRRSVRTSSLRVKRMHCDAGHCLIVATPGRVGLGLVRAHSTPAPLSLDPIRGAPRNENVGTDRIVRRTPFLVGSLTIPTPARQNSTHPLAQSPRWNCERALAAHRSHRCGVVRWMQCRMVGLDSFVR